MCDFGNATVDDAIGRLVEIFGVEVGQDGRGGRTNLGRFQYGRTSGGYGANNWLEAEKNGVIPGSVAPPLSKKR